MDFGILWHAKCSKCSIWSIIIIIIILCKRCPTKRTPEFIKRTEKKLNFIWKHSHHTCIVQSTAQQYVTSEMDVHVNDGISRIEQLKKVKWLSMTLSQLYSTSIKSCILHTFLLSLSFNFVLLFTRQFSTYTHTHGANIRIVNFINIVFIDTEMKETNYSRNRVENSRWDRANVCVCECVNDKKRDKSMEQCERVTRNAYTDTHTYLYNVQAEEREIP